MLCGSSGASLKRKPVCWPLRSLSVHIRSMDSGYSICGLGFRLRIALTPYRLPFHPSVFLSSPQTVVFFQSLPFPLTPHTVHTLRSHPLLGKSPTLFAPPPSQPVRLTFPSSLLFTPLASLSPRVPPCPEDVCSPTWSVSTTAS